MAIQTKRHLDWEGQGCRRREYQSFRGAVSALCVPKFWILPYTTKPRVSDLQRSLPMAIIHCYKQQRWNTKTASVLTQSQAYDRRQFIIYVQGITPDQQNLTNKITGKLTSWLRDFYLLVVKNHKLARSYLACSFVTLHSIKYEVTNVISNVQK